jgi:hypothetical protein
MISDDVKNFRTRKVIVMTAKDIRPAVRAQRRLGIEGQLVAARLASW